MKKVVVLIFFLILFVKQTNGQPYAPAVGNIGTTAIYKDSSAFTNWGSNCEILRGHQDISNIGLGLTTIGDSSMAIGKAQTNGIVSLGDGGIAICQFPFPIKDGIAMILLYLKTVLMGCF